jgi:hypothetical protein
LLVYLKPSQELTHVGGQRELTYIEGQYELTYAEVILGNLRWEWAKLFERRAISP